MKIEAVTICVNYDDFLEAVIPYNLSMFDRWVIVTEPQDLQTRELCRRFGLECLLSEDGRDGGNFAKGRLIERGLQHLSANGWRCHIDADIALPRHFRRALELADLQTDTLYGADRILVKSYDDFQKLKATGWLDGGQWHHSYAVEPPKGFEVGTRWVGAQAAYCPIGFLQLWNSSQDEWRGIRIKPYPSQHNTACRTDVQFALQFDRKKRALLPEIFVAHLESEAAAKGANWNGRKTCRFGPAFKRLAANDSPTS